MATSRTLELTPSNATTNGRYSYKNGVAQITFDIPAGDWLLDPNSLRICGGLNLYKNQTPYTADGYTHSGTPPTISDNLGINTRLGVWGIFQQLIWRSSRHQSTLEHNRHYNRWLSSYHSVVSSLSDNIGHLGATGLTMPNYATMEESVMVKRNEYGSEFCVHLPCGLMNSGQSLNLMPNALGGLTLTLMLESDANFLQVLPVDNTTAPAPALYTDAFYELNDLKLICKVITPPQEDLNKLRNSKQGSLTYQSIHSYYDTANSGNIQLSMLLGLSKVKSLFINMITSKYLNNLTRDGFATLMPTNLDGSLADLKKITWLKGGRTFPKMYPNDTNFNGDNDVVLCDPEIIRDYINSISDYNKNRSSLFNVVNVNRRWNAGTTGKGVPYQFVNDGGVIWGLGVNYENFLGGEGQDFTNEHLGLAIDCDLTSSNAQSLFIFVNAETSIIWNESGVQVIN